MEVKVAVLLVLALFAFAAYSTTALSLSAPKIYGASDRFIKYDDPPAQPFGDPLDDGGDIPH